MAGRAMRITTVAAVLAACGAFPAAAAAADGEVTISGFSFEPGTITVAEGDTVTWTNEDAARHTATGTGIDVGPLGQGASGSVTFRAAGTYDYVCSFHPAMTGTVVVTAAPGSPGTGDEATTPPTDTLPEPAGATRPAGTGSPLLLVFAGIAALAAALRRLVAADRRSGDPGRR